MFQIRRFHNTDPPHLAEIWRSQPTQRAIAQPITTALLEQCVFAKNYFDPNGLLVATKDGKPIGFVHAGFGPSDCGSTLDCDFGTTYQIRVHSDHKDANIEDALLKASEEYLTGQGAKVLYGGGLLPMNGFYLGLYGGSELPGVLDSDSLQQEIYTRNEYRPIDRTPVMHCDLSLFQPPISRSSRECLRNNYVEVTPDPSPKSWWTGNTFGCFDRVNYNLMNRKTHVSAGEAHFWYMEPLAVTWGMRVVGLDHLEVHPDMRKKGMATSLLTQSFCDLRQDGVTLVETQTMINNEPALELYHKLGFIEVDRGTVYRKDA